MFSSGLSGDSGDLEHRKDVFGSNTIPPKPPKTFLEVKKVLVMNGADVNLTDAHAEAHDGDVAGAYPAADRCVAPKQRLISAMVRGCCVGSDTGVHC